MDDTELCEQVAACVGVTVSNVRTFVLYGQPPTKQRPRLGRHGIYKPDSDAENATAWLIRQQAKRAKYTGPVFLMAIFYRGTHHRIDHDNLLKHLCDAATLAGLWNDDSQVCDCYVALRYDAQHPRTVLAVADHSLVAPGNQDSCHNVIATTA